MGQQRYRETFTITRDEDGTFTAKLHGYPFYYSAPTAELALAEAGRVMDFTVAQRDQWEKQRDAVHG